jgi:hypothetical protein
MQTCYIGKHGSQDLQMKPLRLLITNESLTINVLQKDNSFSFGTNPLVVRSSVQLNRVF